MGRVEGKVAFITGAGRGQGRSHAIRLAEEGADIIAVDICADIDLVPWPMSSESDLEQTVKEVEAVGGRIVSAIADVRDFTTLKAGLDAGLAEFGHVDIVVANAGIGGFAKSWELTDDAWHTVLDVNLMGVWHTAKAAIPTMREQGTGGSIICTGSCAGLKPFQNAVHYVAAKAAIIGLVKTIALEVADARIRVNAIHPTNCNTDMIKNQAIYDLFRPDLEHPGVEDIMEGLTALNAWDEPWVQPIDISNAVLWLASDESRFVTGVQLPVDLGNSIK
jgi:SDR family mycofactocin-dependent oxidoreductase